MNNHVDLILKYHQDQSYTGARIVGFEVQARSIKHSYTGEWKDGNPPLEPSACSEVKSGHMDLDMKKDSKEQKEVIWTYGVFWEQSPVKWASRWDAYFKMQDPQIHWFSIMNLWVLHFEVCVPSGGPLDRGLLPKHAVGPNHLLLLFRVLLHVEVHVSALDFTTSARLKRRVSIFPLSSVGVLDTASLNFKPNYASTSVRLVLVVLQNEVYVVVH